MTHRVKTYTITLTLQVDEMNGSPANWNWNDLLDVAGHEFVKFDDVEYMSESIVNDEGEPIKA